MLKKIFMLILNSLIYILKVIKLTLPVIKLYWKENQNIIINLKNVIKYILVVILRLFFAIYIKIIEPRIPSFKNFWNKDLDIYFIKFFRFVRSKLDELTPRYILLSAIGILLLVSFYIYSFDILKVVFWVDGEINPYISFSSIEENNHLNPKEDLTRYVKRQERVRLCDNLAELLESKNILRLKKLINTYPFMDHISWNKLNISELFWFDIDKKWYVKNTFEMISNPDVILFYLLLLINVHIFFSSYGIFKDYIEKNFPWLGLENRAPWLGLIIIIIIIILFF